MFGSEGGPAKTALTTRDNESYVNITLKGKCTGRGPFWAEAHRTFLGGSGYQHEPKCGPNKAEIF